MYSKMADAEKFTFEEVLPWPFRRPLSLVEFHAIVVAARDCGAVLKWLQSKFPLGKKSWRGALFIF